MAIPQRLARGLQDIRTLSGRMEPIFLPHKAHMRIGCLEMEKARRGTEKNSALHRLKNIDARLKEIEAEKALLLELLARRQTGESSPSRSGTPRRAPRAGTPHGFRLKY